MDFKKYIINKEGMYEYLDIFACIKDFIYINNYYHLSSTEITEMIYKEIDQQFPHIFHKHFFESAIKQYMNENKELFIVLGGNHEF